MLVFYSAIGPAYADECIIFWSDLLLPPSMVVFEKTSDASATATFTDTSKGEPIQFDLALVTGTRQNGDQDDILVGDQTLVRDRTSNQTTIVLSARSASWAITVSTKQSYRNRDGRTFSSENVNVGQLSCRSTVPWH